MPEIEEEFKSSRLFLLIVINLLISVQNMIFMEFQVFLVFKNGIEAGRFVSKDRKTKEEIENFLTQLL